MKPLAVAFLFALAIFAVFPYGALAFRPQADPGPAERCACAYESLTPAAIERAVGIARRALSVNPDRIRNERTDILSVDNLPEAAPREVVTLAARAAVAKPGVIQCDLPPFPPTLAAGEPETIEPAAEGAGGTAAFTREELLNID